MCIIERNAQLRRVANGEYVESIIIVLMGAQLIIQKMLTNSRVIVYE